MARYTGAVCRLCRREGQKLFLKGERCYTGKCAVERRQYAPGQHGQARNPARRRNTACSCVPSSMRSAITVCWRVSSAIISRWLRKCRA